VGDIVSAAVVIGVLALIIVWVQISASRRNLVLNSSSALGGLAQLNSVLAPVFSSYPRVHFDYNTRLLQALRRAWQAEPGALTL